LNLMEQRTVAPHRSVRVAERDQPEAVYEQPTCSPASLEMEHPTDNDIMVRVQEGEIDSLSFLFDRHHCALYNFFLQMTRNREMSEDLVQDVFLRVLKYRRSYRSKGSFAAWLYRIARNLLANAMKRKVRDITREEMIPCLEPSLSDFMPDNLLNRKDEIRLLQIAMEKLPVAKREILALSRLRGLPCRDGENARAPGLA